MASTDFASVGAAVSAGKVTINQSTDYFQIFKLTWCDKVESIHTCVPFGSICYFIYSEFALKMSVCLCRKGHLVLHKLWTGSCQFLTMPLCRLKVRFKTCLGVSFPTNEIVPA